MAEPAASPGADAPLRLLLAPNAFKGTFGAVRVAGVWEAALRGRPGVETIARPLSDGGDGALDVWDSLLARGAAPGPLRVWFVARDALDRPARTPVLWEPAQRAGYVETALACGLARIPAAARDPLRATTFGCGQLLLGLLELGARDVTLGLGGSATVDGGLGLARALGYRFRSSAGVEIERAADLAALAAIEPPASRPWAEARVRALTDVASPLLGAEGAARVFGPQKFPPGAAAPQAALDLLERGLGRLAERMAVDLGVEVRDLAGAGAAGGLAAGVVAFAGAELRSGAAHFLGLAGVRDVLAGTAAPAVDGVITGEGSYDAQSERGKLAGALRSLCAEAGVPLAVVAGSAPGRGGDLVVTGADLEPPTSELDEAALAALALEAAHRLAEARG
ncbi:MAG: glycerate kinase [Gemmatimonadota bacterium]